MLRSLRVPVVVLVVAVGPLAARFASPQLERSPLKTYLVVYRPGPAWVPDKPQSEQPLKEHGRYMLALYTQKKMKLAGPFAAGSGGAVVFEAADDEQAKAIVAADPAVTSQVFEAELRGWTLVEWEQYIKK